MHQLFVAGTLYLILETYHSLVTNKSVESTQIAGLKYVSICSGLVIGNQFCSRVSDKVYNWLRHQSCLESMDPGDPNAGSPEYRVRLMMVGVVVYPIGFLIYGWIGTLLGGIAVLFRIPRPITLWYFRPS
jgi:hypothetical protein